MFTARLPRFILVVLVVGTGLIAFAEEPLDSGYFQEMLFLGPIGTGQGTGWSHVSRLEWDPIPGGEAAMVPSEGEDLSVGEDTYTWRRVSASQGGLFNFNEPPFTGPFEDHVVYAALYVVSPQARDCRLFIGSDDGERTYVNGELVYEVADGRGVTPDEDQFDVHLRAGANLIMVKVEQGSGASGLTARLTYDDENIPEDWELLRSFDKLMYVSDIYFQPLTAEIRITQTKQMLVRLNQPRAEMTSITLTTSGDPVATTEPQQVDIAPGGLQGTFVLKADSGDAGSCVIQANAPGLAGTELPVNVVQPQPVFYRGGRIDKLEMSYSNLDGEEVYMRVPDVLPYDVVFTVRSEDPETVKVLNKSMYVTAGSIQSLLPCSIRPNATHTGTVQLNATADLLPGVFETATLDVELLEPELSFDPAGVLLDVGDTSPVDVLIDMTKAGTPREEITFAVSKTGPAADSIEVVEPVTAPEGAETTTLTLNIAENPQLGAATVTISNDLFGSADLDVVVYDPLTQGVVINEFMAQNGDTIDDEFGESSDWIELLNLTDTDLNMENFSLTDNPSRPKKWVMPPVTIEPHGHLLVWASELGSGSAIPGEMQYVSGGGAGIAGTEDGVHYEHHKVSGDFVVTARFHDLDSPEKLSDWARAGVMIRRSLNGNSRHATMAVTGDDKFAFLTRGSDGGDTTTVFDEPMSFPDGWVRLERTGDTIQGWRSYNGVDWLAVGDPVNISLPDEVYVGLCASSSIVGTTCVGAYTDYSVAPSPGQIWFTGTEINTEIPGGAGQLLLHTNFRLAAEGEYIGLFTPDEAEIDSITYEQQYRDISYGRLPDAADNWTFMPNPSPGSINIGTGAGERVKKPTFDPPGGFHDGPLSLAINCETPGVEIHYTTNGSRPTLASPRYTGSVPVSSTRAIRAKAFHPQMIDSEIANDTFLINVDTSLATVCLISDPSEIGEIEANYEGRGQEWERDCHVAMYDESKEEMCHLNAGIRIAGGWSRRAAKKSYRLYFRDRYEKDPMKADLYEHVDFDDHYTVRLRAGGNDQPQGVGAYGRWVLFRDSLASDMSMALGTPATDWRWAIVYRNGQQWGVYDIREHCDDHWMRHNADTVDGDLLKVSVWLSRRQWVIKRGDKVHWNYVDNFLNTHSLSNQADYETAKTLIHIDNIQIEHIVRMYGNDWDWPQNNRYAYHPRTPDGKWGFVVWDTDWTFWLGDNCGPDRNIINQKTGTDGWQKHMYELLHNDEFRHSFVNRFADEMNTRLSADEMIARVNKFEGILENDIHFETSRWGGSVTHWHDEVERIREFIRRRGDYVWPQLIQLLSRFGDSAAGTDTLTITQPQGGTGEVWANTLKVPEYPWTGRYFTGIPVKLRAVPDQNYRFVRWSASGLPQTPEIEYTLGEGVVNTLMPRRSTWKYHDKGTDLGTAWRDPGYDDSGWDEGDGELGYGDGDEVTTLSYGGDADDKYPCYYFRREQTVGDVSGYDFMRVYLRRDDGAVVYINGNEVFRYNMGTGAVTYNTWATSNNDDDGQGYHPHDVPLSHLHEGTNTFAAEVHQRTDSSSDISFDLEVTLHQSSQSSNSFTAVFEPSDDAGTSQWDYTLSDSIQTGCAVDDNGTVYFGCDDGKLYAMNPDGTLKWFYPTLGEVRSTPMIDTNGDIYFGSKEGCIYALHPDGSLKWKYEDTVNPMDSVDAPPALGPAGTIYCGADNGVFYAISPDGALEWSYVVGNAINTKAAIAEDGSIIFGANDNCVHALNSNCTEKWTYQTEGDVESSPAIGEDGTVYVGSKDDKLHAINPDGTPKWQYLTGANVRSSPAIGEDGTVYVGSSDDDFFAINADGTLKWRYVGTGDFDTSPAVGADGNVYAASNDGAAYCFEPSPADPGNVQPLWTYTLAAEPADTNIDASPVIADDGTLYIGSDAGTLAAIRTYSGGPADSSWPMFGRDRRHTGQVPPAIMLSLVVNNGSGSGTYPLGSSVPIIADVPDGFLFDAWTGDTETVNDINGASTTVSLIENTEITATFAQIQQFELVVNNGSGSGTYQTNDEVAIEADVPEGHRFVEWTGEIGNVADVHAASTTVTITADTEITAITVMRYELTVNGGSGGGVYDAGEVVEIEAEVRAGYSFVEWTGDTAGIADVNANPTTITVISDAEVTAETQFDSLSANIWTEPGTDYITPGTSGQTYFDVYVDHVDDCNGFAVWPLVTKDGQPQDDLVLDHAEVHPDLVSIVDDAGAGLINVGKPENLSYAIIPANVDDPGPVVEGAIARFYYNYTEDADGAYELTLDDEPVNQGSSWSTKTVLTYGTGNTISWIPTWIMLGGTRIDVSVLFFHGSTLTFGEKPLASDVNSDDCVNVADLLMVRNSLGSAGDDIIPPSTDVNDDDIVNVADLLLVRNALGTGPSCPK